MQLPLLLTQGTCQYSGLQISLVGTELFVAPLRALFSGRGWDDWASLLQAEPVWSVIS